MSEHIEIADHVNDDEMVPSCVRVFCDTTVKAVNKDQREVLHVITTANPDRVSDVVDASGADLGNFLRHPVVVANHSYRIEDIIGRAVSLTVEEDRIVARTRYRDTPLGKDAFNLASEGLGAWSIGFRPISFKAMKDEKGYTKGFHFTKWELLEYSQVAVPMNPDAVQNAITRGLVTAETAKILINCSQPTPPEPNRPLEAHAESAAVVKTIASRLTDGQKRRLTDGLDRVIGVERARERMFNIGV